MTKFSILDVCPVTDQGSPRETLQNSVDLAQHAERWGCNRYWLAEHHNMPGIASAATAVVIGHIAGATSTMKVGSGGIMLPNHSPLVVAEQFGTLDALYPGRIELGLGRAPGTDQATSMALRRSLNSSPDQFPRDVQEILGYFAESTPGKSVRAIPGEGSNIPVWILGSSLFGAQLAALLGLPFAFASHFAPGDMMAAIQVYRQQFKPSRYLETPYLMLGFNVFAAETEEGAAFLASSMQQGFLNVFRGKPGKFPAPIDNFFSQIGPAEKNILDSVLTCSAIGSPETVKQKITAFISRTQPDELIFTGIMHQHQNRLRSFDIAAQVMSEINNAN